MSLEGQQIDRYRIVHLDGKDEVSPQPSQRAIPRRTVLKWAGLTVVGVAGSSLVLLACGQQPTAPPTLMSTPTSTPLPGTMLYTYRGHADTVRAVAWSPNGKHIASASTDHTVQVWDAVGGDSVAADGGNVFTYRRHTSGVLAVAWNPAWGQVMPDGKRIASASDDKTIQV